MLHNIIDNIYIGDWQDAHQISIVNAHFSDIFTVAKDSPFIGNHYYPLIDGPYSENEKLLNSAIVDLAEVRLQSGLYSIDRILVHCISGFSRSVAVVAGYMIAKGYTTDEALRYIKNVRHVANPVPEMVRLLKEYELYLKECCVKENEICLSDN